MLLLIQLSPYGLYQITGQNQAEFADKRLSLADIQTSPCFFAALSQQAGYFDQAHFDKDFKAISGISPQNYLKTMSDFYYDGTEIYHIISPKEVNYELGTVDRLLPNQ